jgi:hypothetical protein
MIIDQINIRGAATFEVENNAPVGAYRDAPVPGEIAFQRMEPETGQVEFLWPGGLIEPRRYPGNLIRMLRADFAAVAAP